MRLFSLFILCLLIISVTNIIILQVLYDIKNLIILEILLIVSLLTNSMKLFTTIITKPEIYIRILITIIYSIYILVCIFFYIFFIATYLIANYNNSINITLILFLIIFALNIILTGIIIWNLCCEHFFIDNNKVEPIFTDIIGVVNTQEHVTCTICTLDIPIDLSSPIIQFKTCQHKFCHTCAMPWIKQCQNTGQNITCPNCRIILN